MTASWLFEDAANAINVGVPVYLAVPNVSEGRDKRVIEELSRVVSARARLLDRHSDKGHNRTVFTVAGSGEDLTTALSALAEAALERIDMSGHEGAHPCVGALDVCPIVYPSEDLREGAEAIAHDVAVAIGEAGIPVFLYGRLAGSEEHRERAFFREGGFDAIVDRIEAEELAPDHGPPTAHATAGVCLVTARPPLVAFNVWLGDGQAAQARAIASELREAGGGLPGVRAIGLDLDGTGQVSMNIHDPSHTPLAGVLERVEELAESHGAEVSHAELVGLAPAIALEGWPVGVPLDGYDEQRSVIEERLAELVA